MTVFLMTPDIFRDASIYNTTKDLFELYVHQQGEVDLVSAPGVLFYDLYRDFVHQVAFFLLIIALAASCRWLLVFKRILRRPSFPEVSSAWAAAKP
jgi:tricorn protease-like protein